MNFLLVLGLITTAAFAAPVQEEDLHQVAASHDQTNGDSRGATLPEPSRHDSSEANLESTAKLHGSTSSELSLGNGTSLSENKSTESKKSRALVEDEKGKLGTTKSFGNGLSNSHVSVAGDSEHEHGAAGIVREDGDGGSEGTTNSNNAEGSDSHSDFNISTQHEDISGIKESTDVNPEGSGDSELDGGNNQRQSTENESESTEKFIASSVGHKEVGSGHTESGKPRDALEHGGNNESSLGGSTGVLNTGSVVASHTVESEHQNKDSSAVSDNWGSEHRQPKALILVDGSGSGLRTGISESETTKPADSDKLHNDRDGSVNSSGSSGTSENENEHILSKEHTDATLGASISSGGTNTGSSDSVDQNENEHRLSKELKDATLGANITSGGSSTGSSDSVDRSDNEYTKQEISINSFGDKRETERKPVSYVDQKSNSDETKGLGAESEHGLNSGNILQGDVGLNHGVILTEPNGKGVPEDSATQSSAVQTEVQNGDHLLPNALSVGGDHKAGHEGAQESSFSVNNGTKGNNGGSSESLQNHHEITAKSNGKFSLQNGKLLSVPVLKVSKDILDSEARGTGPGNNRNNRDGSLGVTEFSSTGSESIHGKPAEQSPKGFISSTDERGSTGECDYTTGRLDTQKEQRKHRGFAWIDDDDDDKFEEASRAENGNTGDGNKTTVSKDTGASINTTGVSDTTGSEGLGAKLASSVGDGNENKTVGKKKHEYTTETEQVRPEVPNTEGDVGNNKDEQTEHKLTSEHNENKNTEESDDVSGLPKDLGREHEVARDLNTGLEVSLGGGGGGGSTAEDSSVSRGKHGVNLDNVQGETGELVVHPGVTISGEAGNYDSASHKPSLL